MAAADSQKQLLNVMAKFTDLEHTVDSIANVTQQQEATIVDLQQKLEEITATIQQKESTDETDEYSRKERSVALEVKLISAE